MNRSMTNIGRKALTVLTALALTALGACSEDVVQDTADHEPATLRLHITADKQGDLNGTRAGGDQNAAEHEFMNQLCVLIFDAGDKLEAKILPDLTGDADAQTGNLAEYTSGAIRLSPGTKTIYAFANWPTADNTTLNGIIGLEKDAGKPADIDGIVLDDPASKIDFTADKYIPMSAKLTVMVNNNTTTLSVGLDRLVSKVRITVNPTGINENVTVSSLIMTGFADKVTLFADAQSPAGVAFDKTEQIVGPPGMSIAAGGTHTFPDFYVNETKAGNSFNISLTTTQNSGITYEATTVRDNLPRNSIYPLTLTFSDQQLTLLPKAWHAPIGVYPMEYTVTPDGDYVMEMLDVTSGFEITAGGLAGVTASGITWEWTLDDGQRGMVIDENTDSKIAGHFSAWAGQKYRLKLNARWKNAAGKQYNRTYNVIIKVVEELTTRTRSTATGSPWSTVPETINMYIK